MDRARASRSAPCYTQRQLDAGHACGAPNLASAQKLRECPVPPVQSYGANSTATAREEASDAVRPFWASAAVELGALDVIAVLAL